MAPAEADSKLPQLQLAVGGADGSVLLWAVDTGACPPTLHGHQAVAPPVLALAAMDNGRLAGAEGCVSSCVVLCKLRLPS